MWLFARTLGLSLALVASTAAVARADAFDLPAFTASPAALLAETRALTPGDAPATLLLDERTSDYDAQGRVSTRWRLVFVIHDEADANDWRTISVPWSPAHELRPTIRARIIEPGGRVASIDAPVLVEAPATAGPGGALSDRRTVATELPPLVRGAVVEEEIVTADRAPLFAAGTVDIYPLGRDVATRRTVLAYSAPVGRALRIVARQLPEAARAQHDVVGDRQRWRYELGPLPAQPYFEGDVPGDIIEQPYIGVATGASWTAVAQAYRAIIERQIAAAPVALAPELPRTPTAPTVHAIAAWVAARVRYNGAELDDAALIPRTPAETLRRGAGDCKDQAVLLVGLLRQAGLAADVALLATGLDRDVDPDLPGMGSFDHAIVRVRLGADALWLDPTEGPRRPGPLPTRDQGRRALVIADDTRALTPTPGARADDNTVRQVRRFALTELGLARVAQTTQLTGSFELERRAAWRAQSPAARAASSIAYARAVYGSDQVRASANVDDLAAPFTETLEIRDAGPATGLAGFELPVSPRSVLAWLPPSIDVARTDRRHPFLWRRPMRIEVEYRVELPDGYAFAPAPDRTRALGPATLTEHRALEGRTAILALRFDSGPARISPVELAAMRAAVRALEPMFISAPLRSRALLDAHALGAAVREAQRRVAARPRSGLVHAQLSEVLLRAGAGAAARRSARAAIALEPARAELHAQLAAVLLHDAFGAQSGVDRPGALAALQRAHALAPDDRRIAGELSELLERDPTGRPLYGAAELAPAVALRRDTFARSQREDDAHALASVLLFSRHNDEAERLARELEPSASRDALLVAAVAGRAGAAAAIAEAAQLGADDKGASLLETAGWHLANMQQYPIAHALLRASGRAPRLAAALATLAPHPLPRPDRVDPRASAIDALTSLAIPPRTASSFIDAATEHEARMRARRLVPDAMYDARRYAVFADALQDSRITVDARAGAWRVAIDALDAKTVLYVVRDGATAKVVGGRTLTASLGRYALRALEAHRDDQVVALFDWLAQDRRGEPTPQSGILHALWPPGLARSRPMMQLVAAWLSEGTDPAREAAALARCPTETPAIVAQCHRVAHDAEAARGRWLAAARHAALADPASPAMIAGEIDALQRAGRGAEAAQKLSAALAVDPDSARLRWTRALVAMLRGERDDAARQLAALATQPSLDEFALNNTAWAYLILDRELPTARALIDRAILDSRSEATLHTRAAILAELGELHGAVTDLHAALGLRLGGRPGDADWQIAGRIYEALGLTADAVAAYRRVARSDDPLAPYALAKRRLAALRR